MLYFCSSTNDRESDTFPPYCLSEKNHTLKKYDDSHLSKIKFVDSLCATGINPVTTPVKVLVSLVFVRVTDINMNTNADF